VPRHNYATEPSTQQGGANHNFPPPGFNPEQAKKPLSQEDVKRQQTAEAAEATEDQAAVSGVRLSSQAVKPPAGEPTSQAKTEAEENRSLSELAAEKVATDKNGEKTLAKKKEEDKKLTLWQKVKKEANHYWDGTKLLATQAKISSKLALKMAAGYELSRREHRQVRRLVGLFQGYC